MMEPQDPDWPCTWETAELEQLRHGMRMTFRQKLQWLENTLDFAKRLQNAPTRTLQEEQAVYAEKRVKSEDGDTSA